MQIAICVVTYRRPKMLGGLLEGLSRLTFRGPMPDLEVVVADNDAEGSARGVCEAWRPRLPWPLRYCLEPRRGIPHARNAALRAAGDAVDFIAFIDDDEVPDPAWLDELLRVQLAHEADVVTGPVLVRFMDGVPPWVKDGGLFQRRRHPTGERLTCAATGNVLVRRRVFTGIGSGFDERFALTGGEDARFFLRVSDAGFTIVWADEAVVHEWIAPARVSAQRLLLRSYQLAAGNCAIALERRRSARTYARAAARGCAAIAGGVLVIPVGLVAGRAGLVKSLRRVFQGAGTIAGLLGRLPEYYRITDGD